MQARAMRPARASWLGVCHRRGGEFALGGELAGVGGFDGVALQLGELAGIGAGVGEFFLVEATYAGRDLRAARAGARDVECLREPRVAALVGRAAAIAQRK